MPKPEHTVIGQEMIEDMKELIATMKAGGMPAVEKRFTVRRVAVPSLPAPTPEEVKAARLALGASQPLFAGYLCVSSHLVKAWEQGKKTPVGPARRLIREVLAFPAHYRKAFTKSLAYQTAGQK